MRLSDINGGTIARADFRRDRAFENFVRELLDHERRERHASSALLVGPLPRYVGDGQRDLVLTVVDDPGRPRGKYWDPLTWDEKAETWYSCKGGDSWKDDIKKELGNAAYRRFRDNGSLPGAKGKRPSADLLEHLAAGGRYVFVLSQQTDGGRSFLDEIARLLGFWLERAGRQVPSRLRDQLALIDGNHLADFIKGHDPTLSEEVVRALGAAEPAALMSFDAWAKRITPNRQPSAFEHDPKRDEIIRSLRGDSPSIKRVYGPPGMGKTRTVLEALLHLDDDVRGRVRYTDQPGRLLDDLRAWLPGARGVILVVDEIRSSEAHRFIEEFLLEPPADVHMILIGTTDRDNEHTFGGAVECLHLSRLSEDATRAIIEHEFERANADPGEHLSTIERLSEGYPLFAVKLAEALAHDGDALAGGTAETWDAVQRVLVGPRAGRSDDEYERTAEARGRCLLVVLLTRFDASDWETLWERHGQALSSAVDWNAKELRRVRTQCITREILREPNPHHRYVSPANLARMLLNHYLSGPPGPDLGPRIVRYTPELREPLLALAQEIQVRPDALRRLAESYWMNLRRLVDEGDIEGLEREFYGNLAREEAPREAAEVAAHIVEVAADSLDPRGRRYVAETLIHATRRQLNFGTFALAERALARLAQTDESARRAWRALFLAALSPSHEPWERRLELLERHARASDPHERRLVADVLETLLDDERAGPPFFEPDKRDGDWSTSTAADYHAAKSSLWLLALELTEDPDPATHDAARAAIAARFTAPTLPVDAIEALVARVSNWLPQQRSPLLDSVEWIRRHGDRLESRAAAAFDSLARALEPKDLEARLIDHVMHQGWRGSDIEAELAEDAARSHNLATELIHAPVEVRERVVAYLGSAQAKWAHAFMRELGSVDSSRVMLGLLEAHARTHPDKRLLSEYVLGWAQIDASTADAWLTENVHGDLARSVVWALPELPVTPPRFALLTALIDQSRLDVEHTRRFASRHAWTTALDPARVLEMLDLLRDRRLAPTSGLTMTRVLLARPLTDSQREHALGLLGDFLEDASTRRIPMIAQMDAQQAALELAREGQCDRLTAMILRLLEHERGNLGLAEGILRELLGAGYGSTLWPDLRDAMFSLHARGTGLIAPSHAGIEFHLARVGMLDHVDIPELLEWIGTDEARARTIARLTNPHDETLSPLVTELLERFGPDGRVAAELHDRARQNPLVAMGSLEFERRQLAHAQAWSQTADSPATREWAQNLIRALGELIERQELRSALERKYA